MKLKIMTYNVLHFAEDKTGRPAAAVYAEAIRCSGADVVALNETYDEDAAPRFGGQAKTVARLLGMAYYFAPATRLNGTETYGNSILSRYPLVRTETVPIPDPAPRRYRDYYETRCVLLCTVDVNGTAVRFAVTHFGLNPDERENAVKTVLAHTEDERFILTGDLNVLPDDPVLAPIRARLRDAADVFPAPRLSFPADAPDRKIDYIFTSPDINVLEADIPAVVLSDHRPHTATLEIGD